MPVKLTTTKTNGIPVRDMKDGQIGVIVFSRDDDRLHGRVVQKYEQLCIAIGMPPGHGIQVGYNTDCRVRLLEPGETIEIVSN